jgi:uncharacterized protein (DUF1015 family)
MSRIKPFNAVRPNDGWYKDLLGVTGSSRDKIGLLKKLLEPRGEEAEENWKLKKYLYSLETLLHGGNYVIDESPAVYIYERESSAGSQFGIWVLTSLQDLKDGKILKHEETLSRHEKRLQRYREEVGLEGGPVLLTYHRQPEINSLIEKSVKCVPDTDFFYEGSHHRLWSIKDEVSIAAFQAAFAKLENVYVADGHHRLASAAAMHSISPQWITTLYISAGQLSCSAFHRMILPDIKFSDSDFLNSINQYFYISVISANNPFVPSVSHSIGLFYKQQWYLLQLKEELTPLMAEPDVRILQDKIFEPVFGIKDPRTDPQLLSWPANQWKEMLESSKGNPRLILFTLYPLSINELLQQAEKQAVLPPKSTYIEPKVPYGLLLHNDKIIKKNMKGILNA